MSSMTAAAQAVETADLFGQSERDAAIDALHAATAIYTREAIVDQLLDSINWPSGARTLVDSSCGDGAFLGRALQRLLTRRATISDDQVRAVLFGWEIHPFAAAQARQRLCQILVDHGRPLSQARGLADALVRCDDFLTRGPRQRFDVIIGNPPYLRWVNVPEPLRSEYETVLPDYAQADLLHSFLDRCVAMLAPDGELAFVTADRWLFNAGAARLREVVGRRFGLARVQRLDLSSAFYRPKLRKAGSLPRVHPVSVVLKAPGAGVTPIDRGPIFPGEAPYVARQACGTLGDVARVRLSPWLGTPGIFTIDAAVAATLPRESVVPTVDSDDIAGGALRSVRRYAIRTRPGEVLPPAVQAHLESTMPRMCARGRRRLSEWLPPEPFHDFDLSEPSLLVPRIAKVLAPIELPPGRLPINHNISIVRAGAWSLAEISALLSSPEANEWVRHHAAPLENGYHSLTTRLLRTLPLFGAAARTPAEVSP